MVTGDDCRLMRPRWKYQEIPIECRQYLIPSNDQDNGDVFLHPSTHGVALSRMTGYIDEASAKVLFKQVVRLRANFYTGGYLQDGCCEDVSWLAHAFGIEDRLCHWIPPLAPG